MATRPSARTPLQDVVLRAWRAIAAQEWEQAASCFSPDYVRHAGSSDLDLHEFVSLVRAEHSAFPDIDIHLAAFLEQGNSVAFRWRSRGTHLGEYLGVPATNRQIECWGITISTVRDGVIVEDWASWNKYAVLEALGIVPIDSR